MKQLPEKWCIRGPINKYPDLHKYLNEIRQKIYKKDYFGGTVDYYSNHEKTTTAIPSGEVITYEQWKEWYYQNKVETGLPKEWLCKSNNKEEALEIIDIASEITGDHWHLLSGNVMPSLYGVKGDKVVCYGPEDGKKITYHHVSELKEALNKSKNQVEHGYPKNTAPWWLSRIKDPVIRHKALHNWKTFSNDSSFTFSNIRSCMISGYSFIWDKTKEGQEYWEKVADNNPDLLDKPYYEMDKSSNNQLKTNIYDNKEQQSGKTIVSKPVATITRGERYTGNARPGRTKTARIEVGHLSHSTITSH